MTTHATTLDKLREGKATLRQERRTAALTDKIRDLLKAQRVYVEIASSQRTLTPRQRPWNIEP